MSVNRFSLRKKLALSAFIAGCLTTAAPIAHATTYYWDNNGTTAGFGTAAGTWADPTIGDSTLGWSTSSTGVLLPGTVSTSAADALNFGTSSFGLAAGTIAISGSVVVGDLTFGSASGAIVLSAGTINLAPATRIAVNNTTDTIDSVLEGASTSLTKSGSGTLVLSGANTYAGATIVNGGTLQIGNGTTGSLNGVTGTAITFSNTGTVNFNEAAGSTQGMSLLTFNAGQGTVQSTYGGSGNTSLTFSNVAARSVGASGNFVFSGGANGTTNKIVLTQFGGVATPTGTLLDRGLFFGGSSYATHDVGGFLRAYTTGDTNFVASPGATTIGTSNAASNFQLSGNITAQPTASANTINMGANNITLLNGVTLSTNGILSSGGSNAIAITTAGTLQTPVAGNELVIRVNGSTDQLTIAPIIRNNGASATASAVTKTGAGRLVLSAANTYTGITYINSGTVRIGTTTSLGTQTGATDGTIISSGATLDLAGIATGVVAERITASGSGVGGLGAISSSAAIANPFIGVRYLTLAGDTTLGFTNRWDVGSLTAANNGFVGGGYTLNLVGSGAGQASLNFLGDTDLGDININLGSAATSIVYLQGTTTLGRAANTVAITGGSVLNIFSNNTGTIFDKKFALNNGKITSEKTSSAITLPGTISLTNSNTVTANTAAVAITASGLISGTGSLIKAGPGSLTLSNANTYTGTTTVSSGILSINSIGDLGTNSALGAPTTAANGLITLGNAATNGTLLYTGGVQSTNRAIQIGSNTASPAATDTAGAIIQNDGAGALTFTAANFNEVNTGVIATTARVLTLQGSNGGTIAGIIQNNAVGASGTGNVAVTKAGAGTWTLAGANTYSGVTTISAGTLKFANPLALYSNNTANWSPANIKVSSTGTFAVNVGGPAEFTATDVTTLLGNLGGANGGTAGGFAAGSAIGFDTTNAPGGTFTVADQLGNSSGVGGGAVGLSKQGTGTLVLSANNTYTGNTTVTGGTLNITGTYTGNTTSSTLALGTSASNTVVNVSNDMTLFAVTGANIAGSAAVYNQTAGNVSISAVGVGGASSYVANVGYGYFNLTGGTFKSNGSFSIGTINAASNAVAYVGGTGVLDWSGTGGQTVAYGSTASLTIGPGGSVSRGTSANNTWLATNANSTGIINVAGGSLDLGTAGNVYVTNTASPTSVILNVAGGTLTMGKALGMNGGSTGTFYANYAGGTLKSSAALNNPMNVLTSVSTIFGAVTNNNNANAAFNTQLGTTSNFTGGLTVDTTGGNITYGNALLGATGNGVAQANITVNGGTGYIGAPQVQFTGGTLAPNGTPASGYALINSSGAVTGIVITSPGTYSVDPTVTLTGGGGTGASVALSPLSANAADTGLTKIGTGTLTLTGANTYTGTTTVSNGVLQLNGAAATGALTTNLLKVENSATLGFTAGTATTLDLTGKSLTLGGTIAVDIGATGVNDTITVGAFSLTGNSTLTFNQIGAITNGGSYTLVTSASPIVTGGFNLAGQTSGRLTLTPIINTNTITLATTLLEGIWNKTGGGNWSDGDPNATAGNWTNYKPTFAGDAALFGSAITAPSTVAVDAAHSVGFLRFANTNSYTIGTIGSSNLTIDNGTAPAGITVNSGSHTIAENVTLLSNVFVSPAAGTSLTVSGGLSGAGGLQLVDTGTLVLAGNNTYTGNTLVNAGTLRMSGAGTLGAASASVAVSSGALLDLNGTNQSVRFIAGTGPGTVANNSGTGTSVLTLSATPVASSIVIQDNTNSTSGKVAVVIAATTAVLSNSNTYSGGTTVNAGASLYLGAAAPAGAGTGTIELTTAGVSPATSSGLLLDGVTYANDITGAGFIHNNVNGPGTVTFTGNVNTSGYLNSRNAGNVFDFAGSGSSTLSGIIGPAGVAGVFGPNITVSTGSIIKSGTGTLTLSGANLYSGGTTLTSGTLIANNATTPLGVAASPLKLNGGTLDLQTIGTAYNMTVGGNTTILSNNAASGPGTTKTLGTLSLGAFQLNVGPGANVTDTTAAVTFGATTLTGNATVSPALNSTLNLNGAVSGAFSLTVAGAGNVVFGTTGISPTGGLIINSGSSATITLNNAVGSGTPLTVNGTLTNGGGEIFGALNGSGTINQTTNNMFTSSTVDGSFSGTITGAGGYIKQGTSSQTLTGLSSYTGQTLLRTGVLSVNSIKDYGVNSALGAPLSGPMVIGFTATTGTLLYTGDAQSTNRTIQIGSNAAPPTAANIGGAIIQNDGTGALNFSAATFNIQTDAATGVGADRTLTLQGSNVGANTIAGVIQDNLVSGTGTGTARVAVTKSGAGTWNLTGANTYTGPTNVTAGTLIVGVGGTGSIGASVTTVESGATLGGSGTIGGVTIVSGSVAPGNSAIGPLAVTNNVTWNAGNAWVWELGTGGGTIGTPGTGDLLNITGNFAKGSGSGWTFDFSNTGAAGVYKLVDWTGMTGFIDTDFTASNLASGLTSSFTVDSGTSALYLTLASSGGSVALGAAAANSGTFGNLLVGANASTTVTLTNNGTVATTSIAATGSLPGFTLGAPVSGTVNPAANTTASVTVDTSSPGLKSGNLTYTANPGSVVSTPVIALSAQVGNALYGTTMTAATPALYVTPAGGLSSSGTGTAASSTPVALNSTATVLYYRNSTGTDTSVNMNWRTRTAAEAKLGEPLQTSGTNGSGKGVGYLISDVVSLTGMVNTTGVNATNPLRQTDPFVLQVSYNQGLLGNDPASALNHETAGAPLGRIFLAWNDSGSWVNAVEGNIGGTPTFAGVTSWQTYYNMVSGVDDYTDIASFIGSYGVDPANDVAWAVLNHNSEFAVIPEPSTLVLGGLALLGFAGMNLRRWRLAK